jgi:hypothetical protein
MFSFAFNCRLRHDLISVFLPDGSERKAIDVIMHESYDSYHKNHDVAIIRLNQKLEFDQSTSPVCLPLHKQDPAGTYHLLSGSLQENLNLVLVYRQTRACTRLAVPHD